MPAYVYNSDTFEADLAIKVFLVEDMKQLQGVMTDLLGSLGEVEIAGTAATEAEARLWLDEHAGQWQLAVIDLILAQGTGMGVIAKCKENEGHGKVVVFSDYATPGIRTHCLKLGADAVFQKSTQTADFIEYCAGLIKPQA